MRRHDHIRIFNPIILIFFLTPIASLPTLQSNVMKELSMRNKKAQKTRIYEMAEIEYHIFLQDMGWTAGP